MRAQLNFGGEGARAEVDGDGANHANRVERGQAFNRIVNIQDDDGENRRRNQRHPGHPEPIELHERFGHFTIVGHDIKQRDHADQSRIDCRD